MQNYKELEVWQKAVRLATELYGLTGRFPDTEKFGLVSQIRRAVASVAANIAEGWGRGSTKEYIQFLLIARGSLLELETHLIIAGNLHMLAEERLDAVLKQIEGIAKMLNRLIASLKSRGQAVVSRNPNP